jgi:uncharacterized membrane protein (DUF2068 family)
MRSQVLVSSVRVIALVEWVKGALALLLATGLIAAGPRRLQDLFESLVSRLHIGRTHGPFAWIEQSVQGNTVDLVGALCGAYAALRMIEGWGLWRQRRWAAWFGVLSVAVYLPFDLLALHRHPGAGSTLILLLNLGVIGLLAGGLRANRG